MMMTSLTEMEVQQEEAVQLEGQSEFDCMAQQKQKLF